MCLTTKNRKQIRVAQTNRSAFSPIPMSLEISYGWHCFTRPVMSGFITLQFLGFSLLFARWLLVHLVLHLHSHLRQEGRGMVKFRVN